MKYKERIHNMDNILFSKYKDALEHAGPKLKELILFRLEQEADITLDEFLELCKIAYPDGE